MSLLRAMQGLMTGGSGGDPFWPNVVSLQHYDGANGSTTFTDQTGKIWTPSGNVQISTAFSLFGQAGFFDGTGDFLTDAADTAWRANVDFTQELWIRPTNLTGIKYLMTKRNTGVGREWTFFISSGQLMLAVFSSTGVQSVSLGSTTTLLINTAYRVAWTRIGNTFRLFVNGNLEASQTVAFTYGTNTDPVTIGRDPSTAGREFMGYIDEQRTTGGVGRYAASYTLDASPFPNGP